MLGRIPQFPLAAMAALLVGVQWILPQDALWFDLVCIIVFGLPHGALDVEIAREHLVGRMPRLWFPVFAIPYLTMACAVLGLWHAYPVAALCLFLSMSVWHFGETPGFPWWLRLLRGGAVIALPVLLHPAMTAGLLDGIAQIAMPECPAWIKIGSLAWLGLCLAAVAARTVPVPLLRELALLAALYAALPPLTALAIYFVCLHAPAHMHEMIDHRLSARVTSMAAAWCYALPPTLLTLAIGAMLWPLYTGAPVERLLALTLQGLAALTVPHMLMDCVMKRV